MTENRSTRVSPDSITIVKVAEKVRRPSNSQCSFRSVLVAFRYEESMTLRIFLLLERFNESVRIDGSKRGRDRLEPDPRPSDPSQTLFAREH
jgi:hypothetical protein